MKNNHNKMYKNERNEMKLGELCKEIAGIIKNRCYK